MYIKQEKEINKLANKAFEEYLKKTGLKKEDIKIESTKSKQIIF